MIRYWHKGDQSGPVFICDYCGGRISDVGVGAVLTKNPIDGETIIEDTVRLDVLHIHKGPCLDAAENLPGVKAGWNEMSHHVLKLIYNVHLTPSKMQDLLNQLNDSDGDWG